MLIIRSGATFASRNHRLSKWNLLYIWKCRSFSIYNYKIFFKGKISSENNAKVYRKLKRKFSELSEAK